MARIRTVKPSFFRHEELFEAEATSGLPLRLAFVGLWTAADREGRFRWQPRALKLDCLPYDDVDFSRVLDALEAVSVIQRYSIDGEEFGCIPTWSKHQVINQREAQSSLPAPSAGQIVHARARTVQSTHTPVGVNIPSPLRQTVLARDDFQCVRCQSSDDLTVDHIFPQSIGGTHALTNLRTLCRACNSRRPVQGSGLVEDLALDGLTLEDMKRMCMHVQARGEYGREGKGKERTIVAKAPIGNSDFEELKRVYPRRAGNYGWKAAEKKFNALVKTGVDPRSIISAAAKLCDILRSKIGTEFIPMPASWLNSEDFTEMAAEALAVAAPVKGYYAAYDSPQLDAWDRHERDKTGKCLPRDHKGGWRVDAEWPPDWEPQERANEILMPRMQTMQ